VGVCRQTGVQAVSSVRPHTSVPYAFDEPTKPQRLTVVAPGGVSASYDINRLGEGPGLTYENFIYIAFTGTFKRSVSAAMFVCHHYLPQHLLS
jgi:vacuolar protein sorting-associated protein 13D